MSSVEQPAPVRMATTTLTERSSVHEEGGGFQSEQWLVQVNQGWIPLRELLMRGSVGCVTADLVEKDDPSGESHSSDGPPPQVYYLYRVSVTAPAGTLLRRRVWKPTIHRDLRVGDYLRRGDLFPRQQRTDKDFELRRDGRLMSAREAQERRQAPKDQRPAAPPSREDLVRGAASLLTALASAPPTLTRRQDSLSSTPLGSDTPPETAPLPPTDKARRRRPPVRQSDAAMKEKASRKKDAG